MKKSILATTLPLIKQNAYIAIIMIGSYLTNYSLNILLANNLSAEEYGDIIVIFQLLTLLTPLMLLGADLAITRFLPIYIEKNDWHAISGFIRWIFRILIISGSLFIIIGTAIICVYNFLPEFSLQYLHHLHLFFKALWIVPFYGFINISAKLLQVMKKYLASTLFQGLLLFLLILVNVLLFLIFKKNNKEYFDVLNVILSIGIAAGITSIVSLFFIGKNFLKKAFSYKPNYDIKIWRKVSIHMLGITLIFAGLVSIDTIMIEILHRNEGAVGHFAAIVTISTFMAVFIASIGLVFIPKVSVLTEKKDFKTLQKYLHYFNTIMLIPAILFFLSLVIFGKALLSHFGDEYVSCYFPLLALSFSYLIALCLNNAATILTYSTHQLLCFYISLGQISYIILLDCIFIPWLGIYGAIIVLGSSILFSGILRIIFVRHFFKLKSFYFI